MINHGLHGSHGVWAARATGAEIVHAVSAKLAVTRILTSLPTRFTRNPIVVSLQRQFVREESAI